MRDEEKLVRCAQAGDRESFGLLAEACRPWLLGICFRLVWDRGMTEDLVQETLLRALRELPQLREPERFRAWLSRIAVNVCRMHLRRMLARPQESLCGLPDSDLPGTEPVASPEPELDEALGALEPLNRRLLLLYYGAELSQAELGELFSLSAAAIKSRLHRSRERLRKELLTMMTEAQKARRQVTEEAGWKLETILLVEPEELLRTGLSDALRAAGYQVRELPDGEAALAAIVRREGQMLILDKHCIEPNWVEVLTLIRVDARSRENVPVCVFVDKQERDVFLAWHAGATVCLTHPFNIEEVVGFVKQVAQKWPADDLRQR